MAAFLARLALIAVVVPLALSLLALGGALLLLLTVAVAPLLFCQYLRAVRRLPLAGLFYYPSLALLLVAALGLPWWLVVLVVLPTFAFVAFLPDPWTYFARPRVRDAVLRAIEHFERDPNRQLDYHTAQVVGAETGLTVVLLRAPSEHGPSLAFYLAVGKDGAVEELSPEEQRRRYGYDPAETRHYE